MRCRFLAVVAISLLKGSSMVLVGAVSRRTAQREEKFFASALPVSDGRRHITNEWLVDGGSSSRQPAGDAFAMKIFAFSLPVFD
jgi:hypothetical protein